MIQDIFPRKLDNQYKHVKPCAGSNLLVFDQKGAMLSRVEDGRILFPVLAEGEEYDLVYLFSLDDAAYFLVRDEYEKDGYEYRTIRELRDEATGAEVFAAFTAYHLWRWYEDNRFCGRCGGVLKDHSVERARECVSCGNIIYPRINPAVIVGVTYGDELLLTRYRTGYAHNALVAGFTEIGETLEETVAREVMEETGLKVKNIRYYKSQPWGMAQDILVGYYCEVDGDTTIKVDESELKSALWVKREDIELQPNNLSLTNEMMKRFKEGELLWVHI